MDLNIVIGVAVFLILICLVTKNSKLDINENFSNLAFSGKKKCHRKHAEDIPSQCEKYLEGIINETTVNDICDRNPEYIRKTDIPSCPRVPDMSLYINKRDIPSCQKGPNMEDYVKKTNIPSCPEIPNMEDYIQKTQLPSCPKMPDMTKYIKKTDVYKLMDLGQDIKGYSANVACMAPIV